MFPDSAPIQGIQWVRRGLRMQAQAMGVNRKGRQRCVLQYRSFDGLRCLLTRILPKVVGFGIRVSHGHLFFASHARNQREARVLNCRLEDLKGCELFSLYHGVKTFQSG